MRTPQIVLVEDDEVDAKLFKRALAKQANGTRIQVLNDGQQAVDTLLDDKVKPEAVPKLIVLDIKLPRLLGFDVLERLRQDERTANVPVVMLSSSTQQTDVERAYALGANGYISKPSTFSQLSELVEHLAGYWLKYNTVPSAQGLNGR